MKLLENKSVIRLFYQIGGCLLGFMLFSVGMAVYRAENRIVVLWGAFFVMSALIFAACYHYLKEQERKIEEAVLQIRAYLLGEKDGYLACEEEGELYRLFYEINSLVDILDAHIEHKEREKRFLQNTISDISHQLKTPLAALHIYNGILKEEAKELSTIEEFIGLSEQELDRIETLVQNLLKITKFDAGAIILEKRTEFIQEIMETIKKSFLYRARQEEKEILLLGDIEITFVCDRVWLTEDISNLVKNALDHTGRGGIIEIRWKLSASIFQIVVEDNGSGIHSEDLYHIFKRFYRSRYSKDTKGIGLGLPLAKSIVEAHQGSIKVESVEGMGARFTMDFLIPTKL